MENTENTENMGIENPNKLILNSPLSVTFDIPERVIILGDTHIGAKGFSIEFFQEQMLFFDKMISFMKQNGITTILHLGDLFDNRQSIDILLLNKVIEDFFSLLYQEGITFVSIIGNHDMYYKNTREISLSRLIPKMFKNVFIIEEQAVGVSINGLKYGFVPFLLEDEGIKEKILECDFVLGHFETQGFKLANGVIDKDSELTPSTFAKMEPKYVFSGHYHHKGIKPLSDEGTISKWAGKDRRFVYCGTPFQINWKEYSSEPGFFVLDAVSGEHNQPELKFIPNTVSTLHSKVYIVDNTNNTPNIVVDSMLMNNEEFLSFCEGNERLNVKLFNYSLGDTDKQTLMFVVELLKKFNHKYNIFDHTEDEYIAKTSLFDLYQQDLLSEGAYRELSVGGETTSEKTSESTENPEKYLEETPELESIEQNKTHKVSKAVSSMTTEEFLYSYIKEVYPELYPVFMELFEGGKENPFETP